MPRCGLEGGRAEQGWGEQVWTGPIVCLCEWRPRASERIVRRGKVHLLPPAMVHWLAPAGEGAHGAVRQAARPAGSRRLQTCGRAPPLRLLAKAARLHTSRLPGLVALGQAAAGGARQRLQAGGWSKGKG